MSKRGGIFAFVFVVPVVGLLAGAGTNDAKRRISVDEIENAVVIGKLGVPLGEIATIVGRWEDDVKVKGYDWLVVSEVNGTRLEQPVAFMGDLPMFIGYGDGPKNPLALGRTYRLRVYESAGFSGVNSEWFTEAQAGHLEPVTAPFAFRSHIKVLRDITSAKK